MSDGRRGAHWKSENAIGGYKLTDALAIYTAYRAKIVAEDQLVHYRISWMLTSQGILLGIWDRSRLPTAGLGWLAASS
jgi:hypothetical protein